MELSAKIWAYSNSGSLILHAFVDNWADDNGNESEEYLRAMCRKTIARHKNTVFVSSDGPGFFCKHCVKKEAKLLQEMQAQNLVTPVDPVAVETESVVDMDALHAEALKMDEARERAAIDRTRGRGSDVWAYRAERYWRKTGDRFSEARGYIRADTEDSARFKIVPQLVTMTLGVRNVVLTRVN